MWYRRNVPGWEGWLRILVGLTMLAWGAFHIQTSGRGLDLVLGGLFMAATGFVGYCPVCKLVGRKPIDKV
jgi:hypothetical protein